MDNCKVSVITITYNQCGYLERAIKSILAQKVSFEYELIIHDDVSTDSTEDILKKYESLYPEKIRVIRESENQYSEGADFFGDIVKNTARGEYIAICEGDDFWTDDNKLQIQYNALEAHPECDMCACWGCTVTEDGDREISQIRPRTGDGILTAEDVILGGGQYLVTAGLFFRKSMYNDMKGLGSLDYSMQMIGALKGGIYYIDRKMAVYRRYAQGSWTNDVLVNDEKLKLQWEKEVELLNTLDKNTGVRYHEVIIERIKAYTPFEDQLKDHRDEIMTVLSGRKGDIFIWGMGRRGKALQKYLADLGITVCGVCDAVNENIGGLSACGNKIVTTDYVLENAATIIASTRFAYDDLIKSDFAGEILDFQKYMPYG